MGIRSQIGLHAVVVGGGLAGCNAALHLVDAGLRVTLLERASLGSGATHQAAGLIEVYHADPLVHDMGTYALELYARAAAVSGRSIGFRDSPRLVYASSAATWETMRQLPDEGRARGVRIAALTPDEIEAHLPIIDSDGLIGGLWIPGDAQVNAALALAALADAARAGGASLREHVRVLGLQTKAGAIDAVVTEEGEIRCDLVIVAAGLESPAIVQGVSQRLPLLATDRWFLITPRFGAHPDLPSFASYDDRISGCANGGGLFIEAYQEEALQWVRRRFPPLRTLAAMEPQRAAEGFTPDGRMLLGPVPGVSGLYTSCGFNGSGFSLAPAAGRFLAEWIVAGAPSRDLADFDVRRLSPAQSTGTYLRERVFEVAALHTRLTAGPGEYRSARDFFRSPLHDRLAEAGAHFESINAWERASWLTHGSADALWTDGVTKEMRAADTGVLVVDRSGDTKILLSGPGATAWFDEAAPPWLQDGSANSVHADVRPLPSAGGHVDALVRVFARGPDWCVLSTGPDQETRLKEWLRRVGIPDAVHVHDDTPAYVHLELYGPKRAALIRTLTASATADETGHSQPATRWTGAVRFHIRNDPFNDSTLMTVPAPTSEFVWNRLIALGRGFDLMVGGHLAEEALRIRRGIPLYGREISPSTRIGELRAMLLQEGGEAQPSTFGSFSSSLPSIGFGSRDAIIAGDRCIGVLTSRLRLPGWPAALAMGSVDFKRWRGEKLFVMGDGARWPLEPRETPWEIARRVRSGST